MKQLAPREKQTLIIGGVVVGILVLVFGVIAPLNDSLGGMDARYARKQEQVEEARRMQGEIMQLKQQLDRLERKVDRQGGASLFSVVEKSSDQLGIRDNLVSMRPQAQGLRDGFRIDAVDLKLEKVRYDQLVSLLALFDASDMLLNVRQLKVKKRFDDPTLVDVNLQVEAVQGGS